MVEVGVDVPNANVMVVENAERLVWPNFTSSAAVSVAPSISHFAFCSTTPKAEGPALEKLSVLQETSDGFVIAEADLRLRGPAIYSEPLRPACLL